MWPVTLSGRLPVSLGKQLPYQLADRIWAYLEVAGPKIPTFNQEPMPIQGIIRYYLQFPEAMSDFGANCSSSNNRYIVTTDEFDTVCIRAGNRFESGSDCSFTR